MRIRDWLTSSSRLRLAKARRLTGIVQKMAIIRE